MFQGRVFIYSIEKPLDGLVQLRQRRGRTLLRDVFLAADFLELILLLENQPEQGSGGGNRRNHSAGKGGDHRAVATKPGNLRRYIIRRPWIDVIHREVLRASRLSLGGESGQLMVIIPKLAPESKRLDRRQLRC